VEKTAKEGKESQRRNEGKMIKGRIQDNNGASRLARSAVTVKEGKDLLKFGSPKLRREVRILLKKNGKSHL